VAEECGFALTRCETLHLSQWTQKHLEWHYGMQSSPHHGCNGGDGSPWGLTDGHKCNVSNQKPKDEVGLIWSTTHKKKHLKANENMK